MVTGNKFVALEALSEASRLAKKADLTVIERVHLSAFIDFAITNIEQIQELKRQRKQTPAAPPQGTLT